MKNIFKTKLLVLTFLSLVTLISCNLFSSDKIIDSESTGYLKLNLSSSKESRTVSPILIVTSYNIVFSNGPVSKESISSTDDEQIIPLHTGTWDIHVDALNSGGDIVESGDVVGIEISIDQILNETIVLTPSIIGSGTVDLTVTWTDATGITGYDITLDNETVNSDNYLESKTDGTTILTYSQELVSGSYNFLLILKKDEMVIGNIFEVFNIYDNLTSSKVISLTEADFTQIPNSPENLIANEGLGCINITWNDNSFVETGYIIERRVEGDIDFTILDSNLLYNTNSFIDSDIIENTVYEYRVKAFNAVGESEYTAIDSCSLELPDVTGLENDETPTQSKTFSWSSSDETAIFRYLINSDSSSPEEWSGSSWADTSSTTYSNDTGNFYIHVQSKDIAGNISPVSSVSFILDNTSPEIIGLTNKEEVVQSFTWNWTSDDDTAQYKYIINDTIDDTIDWSGVSWSETDTATIDSGDGIHYLHVITKDSLGNESSTYTVSVNLDNTAPSIPIITGITPTNNLTPLWDWDDVDGATIYRCGYAIDEWISNNLEVSEFTPLEDLAAGSYTLYVQVSDSAGNWSSSGEFTITIDTTLPDTPVLTGLTPTNDSTPEWSWGAVDEAVAYRYGFSESSWIVESTTDLSFTPDSSLEDGDHTLYVQSLDQAGNWSTSGYRVITVDTVAPELPSVSAVTPTSNTKPTWSWSLSEDTVQIRYQLGSENQGAWIVESNQLVNYTPSSPLSDGDYSFYIQAKDIAGNWSVSTIYTVNIDTTDPVVDAGLDISWTNSITVLDPSFSDVNQLTYTWEKLPSSGTVNFDDKTVYDTSVSGILGEEGVYALQLTATDSLGNSNNDTLDLYWDNKGPTPGNSGVISVSLINHDSLTLNWNEASDASTLSSDIFYKVIGSEMDNINTVSDAETEGDSRFVIMDWTKNITSSNVTNLINGAEYYFNVLVKDQLGNKHIYDSIQQTITGELGLVISIESPQELTITFDKEDNATVMLGDLLSVEVLETFDSYMWFLNGSIIPDLNEQIISLDSSNLTPGFHVLSVVVTSGDMQSSNQLIFQVHNEKVGAL